MSDLLTCLRHRFAPPDGGDCPDGQLLRQFLARDQAAFAALVRRHGPLVFGVCRRLLADGPDAEDAFQATFLVLARRAATLTRPRPLGPWLYGVALRTARALRRRRRRERPLPADLPARSVAPPDGDLRERLDAALRALPGKYRE